MRKIAIGNSVYIEPNNVTLELDKIEIQNTINSSFNIEIVRNNAVIKSLEFPLENNTLYKGDYLSRDGIHRVSTGAIEQYTGNQITAIQYFDNLYVSGGNFYVRVSNQNAILKMYYEKEEEIDEQIYVLNKNEELITVFNKEDENPIFNPRIRETQNAEAVFTFSISPYNPKWNEINNPENLYVVGGKVFSTNFEGCFQEFITESNEDYITVTAYERQKLLSRKYVRAWNSEEGFEFIDTFMVVILSGGSLPLINNGVTVNSNHPRGTSGYVLDGLLYGTGWTTGTCDLEGVFDFETDQIDIYENILKVQEIWGGILVFDSYNKVVHHRDETKWLPYEGFEVKYQKNMQSLEKLYNNKIITKLCPLGEGGLNIKSVNNDSEWITNFSYTDSVLEGIENNPDINDPEQLMKWGERKLKDLCKPRKELTIKTVLLFQLEGYELEKIGLNDIVDIINYNGIDGEIEQLRVVLYDYGVWDYSDAVIEVSDITLESTDIFKKTVSASNSINAGTLDSKRVVNFFKNGQSISASLKEIDQSIVDTKSELYKSDEEIGAKIQESVTNINTLSNTIISQQETIESLKLTIEGLTNQVTEKGGNNLIYYDSDFWVGESKIIPDEYEKVKCIKSTGTQYIDTNYKPKTNTAVEMDLRFDGYYRKNGSKMAFLGSIDENNSAFSINFSGSKEDYYTFYVWTDITNGAGGLIYGDTFDKLLLFTRNKMRMQSDLFEYGETMKVATKTTNNNTTMFLFGRNNNGTPEPFSLYELAIYETKIYEDGILIKDFIPCIRKSDNKVGMYDLVNATFHTNQGTGEFEYEYELPEEYQEVEYLESSGSQYIDTGHVFTGKTTFDLDILETQHGNSEWCMFIGTRTSSGTTHMLMNCNTTGFIGGDYGTAGSAFQGSSSNMLNNLAHIETRIESSNYKVYLSNGVYATTPYQEFTTGLNGYLFGFNVGGNAHMREAHFRIYDCKIYEDGVLVRDFVPCYKKENNVAGFYDMENNVFYPNNGNGNFIQGKNVSEDKTAYTTNKIEEYTNTEIKNNSISGVGYLLNNGIFEQQINNIVNGFYTISFKYIKLKELSEGAVIINDKKYELNEMVWTKFTETIEVNSNSIKIEFVSDSNASFYIIDTLVNLGITADIWTQNPNETRTDTVTIGKGIQVDSTATNTYHRIDSDGNRTYNKQTGVVVSEQTDKGTKTVYLEANEGEMAGLLFQEVTYGGSEQAWISSLL